jgi:hypothetical protein
MIITLVGERVLFGKSIPAGGNPTPKPKQSKTPKVCPTIVSSGSKVCSINTARAFGGEESKWNNKVVYSTLGLVFI